MAAALQSPILMIGKSHQPLMYRVILITFMVVVAIGIVVAVSAWRKWRSK